MKNKLLTTLPYIDKEYRVKFDVYPTIFKPGWSNVIHFTVNGNVAQYGDRIPAVYFHSFRSSATPNLLRICSAINGDKNHCYNSKRPGLRRNQWSTVEIAQTKVNNNYSYTIHLNGVLVYSIINNDARNFSNVKVYAGDGFYDSQPGFIRNLSFQGKNFISGRWELTCDGPGSEYLGVANSRLLPWLRGIYFFTKFDTLDGLQVPNSFFPLFFILIPIMFSSHFQYTFPLSTIQNHGFFSIIHVLPLIQHIKKH